MPPWADVSRLGARIQSFYAIHSPKDRVRSLDLARQATRRDPSDPAAWAYLAKLELVWGSDAGARRAVTHALRANPWFADALVSGAVVGRQSGDEALFGDSCRRLAVLGKKAVICRGPATVDP